MLPQRLSPIRCARETDILSHLFSIAEANRAKDELLPMVEKIVASKRRMGELMGEVAPLHQLARRDRAAQKRLEEAVRQLEVLANELKEAMVVVESRGAVMKDLDLGLLDFPAILEGQPVYLCWRLGEAEVAFYHGVDEGFPGRRALPDK